MPRRLLALACWLALAGPLSGCWVVSELDKSQKFLDDHSPKAKEKAETEAAAEKNTARPAKKHAVDDYFAGEAKAGTTKTFAPGQVNAGIVACRIGRKTEFMTRENCAASGGRD